MPPNHSHGGRTRGITSRRPRRSLVATSLALAAGAVAVASASGVGDIAGGPAEIARVAYSVAQHAQARDMTLHGWGNPTPAAADPHFHPVRGALGAHDDDDDEDNNNDEDDDDEDGNDDSADHDAYDDGNDEEEDEDDDNGEEDEHEHEHEHEDGDEDEDDEAAEDAAFLAENASSMGRVDEGNAPFSKADLAGIGITGMTNKQVAHLGWIASKMTPSETAKLRATFASAKARGQANSAMMATARKYFARTMARIKKEKAAKKAKALETNREHQLLKARLEAEAQTRSEEHARRLKSAMSSKGSMPMQQSVIILPPKNKEEADIQVVSKSLAAIQDAAARSSYQYFQLAQRNRDDPLGLTLKDGAGTDDDLDTGPVGGGESCANDDPHCLDGLH